MKTKSKEVPVTLNLNRRWLFAAGMMPEMEQYDYFPKESDWYPIHLPHSFGIPYYGNGEFYVGYGCYRKTISLSGELLGEHDIFLEFGAVFQHALVYVNGCYAGEHSGGYTGFIIDITSFLNVGVNLIAVRVNNLWNPKLAPRAGEHTFNGGIYRDVSLLIRNRIHFAWYGTAITTPSETGNGSVPQSSLVQVTYEVINHTNKKANLRLAADIAHDTRGEAATLMTSFIIPAGETMFCTLETQIPDADLWSPSHPALYMLHSTLISDKAAVLDEETIPFGIRYVSFDRDTGFFLNGESLFLQGANVHQDHGGWGDAVTHSGITRDLMLMKSCGMNFIRGSHYPHHPFFSAECDRVGLLFWSELCFWGCGGQDEGFWFASAYPEEAEDQLPFEESCMQTLAEMIRIHRNHPSIFVWSMCNEVFFTAPSTTEKARNLLRRLVDSTHQLDSSRPAAVGGVQRGAFDLIGDIAGYNGDGAVLFNHPDIPNLVSEYGSIQADRPGNYSLCFSEGSEETPAWRMGRAIWCGFHHGSIANIGHLGIVDLYRLPLRSYYCYREQLIGTPPPAWACRTPAASLLLETDLTCVGTDGLEDCMLIVKTLDAHGARTNKLTQVMLRVLSGPGVFPTGKEMILSHSDCNFLDGIGAIEFRSYYPGTTVIEAWADQGIEPAQITLQFTGNWDESEPIFRNMPPLPVLAHTFRPTSNNNLAKYRPCRVSSELAPFIRCNVNDGLDDTCWKWDSLDTAPYLMIDLEKIYHISSIHVKMKQDVSKYVSCTGSFDAETWFSLSPQSDMACRYVSLDFSSIKENTGVTHIIISGT